MRPAMIVLAAILLLLPATLRAEEVVPEAATADSGESPERKRHPPRDIEWASIGIGTGSFLLNARLSGPTLIWERFYWTTLHAEVLVFKARSGFGAMGCVVGQSFGFPWFIDPAGRQELRAGVLAGFFTTASFPLLARDELPPDAHLTHYWLGLGLGPELTYLYRLHKHVSLTVGFRSAFATLGRRDFYPFPYLAAQVGLAF